MLLVFYNFVFLLLRKLLHSEIYFAAVLLCYVLASILASMVIFKYDHN